MTGGLTRLTLAEARDGLAAGDFSAVALTAEHLDAMARARALNAYITETPDMALGLAEAADARRAAGKALGPLDGVPIAVKDLFCTEGVQTTAASHILEGFTPTYELTVTRKLREGGAVMLGKTNLDEFAMGSSNETSHFGPVKNPWGPKDAKDLVPGGSSGGSAAAVAAHLCLGATGTDTGGSIRQPASFCGVVGLKPTYGRCSRWGIIAFASSLDQAGPMTRTVRDAAIMLGAMAGYDPLDSTSMPLPVPNFEAATCGGVRGLRIGIPREYRIEGMAGEIERLWRDGESWLRDAGADDHRGIAAAHPLRARHLLHHRARRGLLEPRPLRRGALRLARAGRVARRDVPEHARRGFWRRSSAAHPDRHLRALRRLLRRLLPQSTESTCADRP